MTVGDLINILEDYDNETLVILSHDNDYTFGSLSGYPRFFSDESRWRVGGGLRMVYFKECKTIDDVKAAFKALAKKLHPDCGGDAEEFKAMMQEYASAFNNLKGVYVNSKGETYTKATSETPEQFADIINKVIFFEDVKIEIIGSWVWLSGNTFIYKDVIKDLGFFYSNSKKAWYYNGDESHSGRRGRYSMQKLRERWGSDVVENQPQPKLA